MLHHPGEARVTELVARRFHGSDRFYRMVRCAARRYTRTFEYRHEADRTFKFTSKRLSRMRQQQLKVKFSVDSSSRLGVRVLFRH